MQQDYCAIEVGNRKGLRKHKFWVGMKIELRTKVDQTGRHHFCRLGTQWNVTTNERLAHVHERSSEFYK